MELQGGTRSKPIPIDIVIEILLRLPVKSTGRCRCVSKLWASIIRLPYFLELFFTKSSDRPQILFAYIGKDEVLFFSSPQPQNPDENSSSSVTTSYLSRVPYVGSFSHISASVHGLVCLTFKYKEKSKEHIICNPSTGQALTLPKVVAVRNTYVMVNFLGYDPIDKQFKVLSMEKCSDYDISLLHRHHQVLTLGTQKLEWRMVKCCIPHQYFHNGICIKGVLYYRAFHSYTRASIIVCFHFRSEEFSFIEVETTFKRGAILSEKLINYNGKLGSLHSQGWGFAFGENRSSELLVIGDFEKQEWSTHKYMLPPMWKNVLGEGLLRFVGFIRTSTVVLSHGSYFIYYNIENSTYVNVGIQEMEGFQCYKTYH